MNAERFITTVNAVSDEQTKDRGTPVTDPASWAGQLEVVEDPYTAKEDRRVETGFRGRQIEVVRNRRAGSEAH